MTKRDPHWTEVRRRDIAPPDWDIVPLSGDPLGDGGALREPSASHWSVPPRLEAWLRQGLEEGRLSVNDVRYSPALRVRAEGIITDLQVRSVDAEMALRALAGWIRDYARLKDWDAYPQELLDAEKVLDRRDARKAPA